VGRLKGSKGAMVRWRLVNWAGWKKDSEERPSETRSKRKKTTRSGKERDSPTGIDISKITPPSICRRFRIPLLTTGLP